MACSSILFVCLGNICRSPLAEGIAKNYAEKSGLAVTIESRGTGAYHVGEPPCVHSQRIAKQNGIDISSQRARQVCQADFTDFDIIVGLDENNVADLQAISSTKIYKLGDFGYQGACVPDPYFFAGFEGFEKVYAMIDTCVKELLHDKVGQTF
ncbi:MAG: low molecular weight protein-tyrosine-phosphatase [Campylobacterota bacterium]